VLVDIRLRDSGPKSHRGRGSGLPASCTDVTASPALFAPGTGRGSRTASLSAYLFSNDAKTGAALRTRAPPPW
jgi:hypothetical protein